MSYLAYPEYKPTNIEWLGEIPSGWQLLPCRSLVKNKSDKNIDLKNQNYLSVMANVGVLRYEDKGNVGNKKPDDLSKCKIVKRGNLVINSMNYAIGSYGMSNYDGICSPVYIVLEANKKLMQERYALRVFENKSFQKYMATFGNGILAHRAAIGWDDFKGVYIPVPPKDEQLIILNFLDYETDKIDTLIKNSETLISLLREKLSALISDTVTQGLTRKIKFKPSGIDWLKEMPAHWNVVNLRFLGRCQNGINIGAEFFGTGHPFVSYGDVYNNFSLPKLVTGMVQSSLSDRNLYSVKEGDVFFTRTSETIEEIGFASTCLTSIENATFAGFLIRFRPFKGKLFSGYSKYYFRNQMLRAFFVKEMNIVTRASLSQDLLKKLPVLLPPIEEQKEIAKYLDNQTLKINSLINETEKQIQKLKERRSALISAAVTGKIDVREWNKKEKAA